MTKSGDRLGEQLPLAEKLFKQLRDFLFSCSHELARTGGANWDRAEALFKLAKSADQLRNSVISVLSNEEVLEASHSNYPTVHASSGRKGPIGVKKAGRMQKQNYPRYCVRGNLLFKTGLSRDAQKEYEHVLPKKDFDEIISLLGEFSASNKDFGVEEIQMQLRCPAYQIYTVLSLLKARDILLVPKRGLYSFRTPKAFLAEAANLWDGLRTHDVQTSGKVSKLIHNR